MNQKKLVFYSGGRTAQNHRIHRAMVELVGKKKSISMTYVPCHPEHSEIYFKRAVRRYRPFGVKKFFRLPVERTLSKNDRDTMLKSDIVYLAGGNTFFFLKMLREKKLITALRTFVRRGGVLAGLSAGGLLMTPNIELAGYPKFDSDENSVGLKDLRSLNLVNFDFSPHFYYHRPWIRALEKRSRRLKRSCFAVKDGGGILIDRHKVSFIGSVYLFSQGGHVQISGSLQDSKP